MLANYATERACNFFPDSTSFKKKKKKKKKIVKTTLYGIHSARFLGSKIKVMLPDDTTNCVSWNIFKSFIKSK